MIDGDFKYDKKGNVVLVESEEGKWHIIADAKDPYRASKPTNMLNFVGGIDPYETKNQEIKVLPKDHFNNKEEL